jgi:hypothetical protein
VILCSTASGSGGWLLKTVKTMVNAGSRLCAFVRWAEFASPLLLVLDSVTFSSEMKGQRQWWGCSSSLCRSSAFLSPQFCFSFPVSLSLFPAFFPLLFDGFLLLFYSLSVFRFLLLLAFMKREGSCWSRFERDSPLLLVLGERCCLEPGLWRRRVTDRVVWFLFFLLMVGDGSGGCPRC